MAVIDRFSGYAMCKKIGLRDFNVLEPPLASTPMYLYLHERHADLVDACNRGSARFEDLGDIRTSFPGDLKTMSTLTLPFPATNEAKIRRRRLAPRMVLYTLLFSSVVTFFATALQLYLDYSRDVEAIVSRISQIENSYLQSIELSLWTMDYEQLRAQLEGIRALPDMQYLEIEVNDAAMISVGADQGRDLIRQAFPLTHPYRNINVDLGTLHVVASLDAVYRRLYDKILVIFGAQAVKTFLVATFMLLLFQWLVGRHLAQISSSVRRKRLEAPGGVIALHRTQSVEDPPDELDDVVNAFNEMCSTLQHSYDRLGAERGAVRSGDAGRQRWRMGLGFA